MNGAEGERERETGGEKEKRNSIIFHYNLICAQKCISNVILLLVFPEPQCFPFINPFFVCCIVAACVFSFDSFFSRTFLLSLQMVVFFSQFLKYFYFSFHFSFSLFFLLSSFFGNIDLTFPQCGCSSMRSTHTHIRTHAMKINYGTQSQLFLPGANACDHNCHWFINILCIVVGRVGENIRLT